MTKTTKLAMLVTSLVLAGAASTASASIVTPSFHPASMQFVRHGADDFGCDDHGRNNCAKSEERVLARRGADDRGCDDHGRNNCAKSEEVAS